MTEPSLRSPIRPLGYILSARANGHDTLKIERENIEKRHEGARENNRLRAQGRLLCLGIMFLCLYLFAKMASFHVGKKKEMVSL